MNPALASIERAMARSELHNDPMHCVLEAMHGTIVHLDETVVYLDSLRVEICQVLQAARQPVDMDRLVRSAALGCNEQSLAMVRAIEARNRWRRLMAETLRAALYLMLGGLLMGKLG